MRVSLLAVALASILVAAGVRAQDTTVYTSSDEGVSLPQVVKRVGPQYTSEAMQQMIEGEVLLDVVVKPDGNVGDVAVKQSLDAVYGLDQEAIKAMKQWQFKPGMKDGKAVAVRVDVKMRFTLR
jgi:TonB family protein